MFSIQFFNHTSIHLNIFATRGHVTKILILNVWCLNEWRRCNNLLIIVSFCVTFRFDLLNGWRDSFNWKPDGLLFDIDDKHSIEWHQVYKKGRKTFQRVLQIFADEPIKFIEPFHFFTSPFLGHLWIINWHSQKQMKPLDSSANNKVGVNDDDDDNEETFHYRVSIEVVKSKEEKKLSRSINFKRHACSCWFDGGSCATFHPQGSCTFIMAQIEFLLHLQQFFSLIFHSHRTTQTTHNCYRHWFVLDTLFFIRRKLRKIFIQFFPRFYRCLVSQVLPN